MTIEILVITIIVGVVGLIFGLPQFFEPRDKSGIVAGIVILIVSALICSGIVWWQLNTESGKRAYKSQQSNLS